MPATETLAAVLDRIGGEIERIADRLSALVVPADATAALPESLLVTLQDIDASEQSLRLLGVVLSRLSKEEAGSEPVDLDRLAANLPLASVVAIVRGTAAKAAQSGEFDLF